MSKNLLVVFHAPSPNLQTLLSALISGANDKEISGVDVVVKSPFDTTPEDIKRAHAIILGTPENLGYMSGALKDMFDRIYYPCLEETQGRPYALFVRAGHDGTGTCRAVATITTGLRWKEVQAPVVCRGDYKDSFAEDARNLGMLMAASLEAGII
ncbi:MAG: NAD(P)H-dependent oxidoreductase [Hahellaceae bacterium]|nr:NAD(P)H-dependent oxidoreductase [Hahellaceae bacterium]